MKKLLLGSIVLALAAVTTNVGWAAEEVVKIPLAEPFAEYHPADGGRALVFYFPKAKQVAVYDTVKGRIRGSIKVNSNDVRIAASKDTVFVALVDQGMIETYSLATLQRNKAFTIPDKKGLKEMMCGSTSQGPLWIHTGERIVPINPATGAGWKAEGEVPAPTFNFRPSADGMTLVAWGAGGGDQRFLISRLRGESVSVYSSPERIPMPNKRFSISANGNMIFLEGKLYDSMGQLLPEVKPYTNVLPTSDPRFFIAVKATQDKANEIAICSAGDRKVLAEVPDVGALGGWTAVGDLPRVATVNEAAAGNGESRVVFLPNEKIIATITEGNKEIQIRPFDLVAAMEKKGDYLFVDSFPETGVTPGKPFAYGMHVVSKKGSVKYEMQSGPTGMTVAADGKVSWNVPGNFTGKAEVIIGATDASGQSAYHQFTLVGPPGKDVAVAPPRGGAPAGSGEATIIVGPGGPLGGGPIRLVPGGGGAVAGQNVMVVRNAVTGERAKGDKPTVNPLTTVRGMVVSRGPDGEYHGAAVEIFAAAARDDKGQITIRGTVGKEMRVSLDEAIRLVEIRQPKIDRASLDLSFGDKYSTKDGGSAGTAFTLLLLASMGEFELNPDAAITGDITIDSKVRTVGQTPAKAHGAALDKVKMIAVPEGNISEFDDTMVMGGAAAFWEAQIFSVKTLDDAIAVMRKDQDAKLIEAMKLFDKLKTDFSAKAPSMLNQAGTKEIVAKILELAPNHLSMRNLQLIATAKQPKTLTAMGTVREAMRSMGPMRSAMMDEEPHPELIKNGSISKARQSLEKVLRVADKAGVPVVTALDQFCVGYSAWCVTASDPKATADAKDKALKLLMDRSKAVDSAMDAVVSDKDVVDKMMHD